MKLITLTLGYEAIVDDEDFDVLDKHSWTADVRPDGEVYAYRREGGKKIYMHRQLIGAVNVGVEVDHINNDALDNRRSNLRESSRSENGSNRQGANVTSLTGVRGVTFDVINQRYRVQVTKNGKNHTFGRYDTIEEAERVAISARLKLFGK